MDRMRIILGHEQLLAQGIHHAGPRAAIIQAESSAAAASLAGNAFSVRPCAATLFTHNCLLAMLDFASRTGHFMLPSQCGRADDGPTSGKDMETTIRLLRDDSDEFE